MEIKEDECIIQYNIKEKILKFEKELRELFKSNGFRFTGSGYGCGVRDLCFRRNKVG